jgi:hypothetical protein
VIARLLTTIWYLLYLQNLVYTVYFRVQDQGISPTLHCKKTVQRLQAHSKTLQTSPHQVYRITSRRIKKALANIAYLPKSISHCRSRNRHGHPWIGSGIATSFSREARAYSNPPDIASQTPPWNTISSLAFIDLSTLLLESFNKLNLGTKQTWKIRQLLSLLKLWNLRTEYNLYAWTRFVHSIIQLTLYHEQSQSSSFADSKYLLFKFFDTNFNYFLI